MGYGIGPPVATRGHNMASKDMLMMGCSAPRPGWSSGMRYLRTQIYSDDLFISV
jgi:hypothetical protein